ncbi:helix-turn-helix transcriptional regulator [Chitinibacter fontanus]|uniref:Helix-turn-helix transcriptional regulator n=1 Tax=Chitinibacter fontanus TaxID=1737446 RepID=A0A7D5ZCD4_9NEIS|nr:helix-turn-helix transcriptional regulator [Chitinibacter fontanus]QLI80624.1 helix-turn-helix transcriptional regulator [Chitinibacter fontanus]
MPAPYSPNDLNLPPPAPLLFRHEQIEAQTGYAEHRHPWGQLNRINLGLIEITSPGQVLVAPADYIVWVPAEQAHAAYIRQALAYTSAYVSPDWAARLPQHMCLISQTPLIRALFDDFYTRKVSSTAAEHEQLQAELLLQRLLQADQSLHYLPETEHRYLAPILAALRKQPGDTTTLAQWAKQVHTTERTLARHFQRELGLSFLQWRNRLRLLSAQALLKQGIQIQDIAWQLGYSNTSAFIAMFRQQAGISPERYRQQSAHTQLGI